MYTSCLSMNISCRNYYYQTTLTRMNNSRALTKQRRVLFHYRIHCTSALHACCTVLLQTYACERHTNTGQCLNELSSRLRTKLTVDQVLDISLSTCEPSAFNVHAQVLGCRHYSRAGLISFSASERTGAGTIQLQEVFKEIRYMQPCTSGWVEYSCMIIDNNYYLWIKRSCMKMHNVYTIMYSTIVVCYFAPLPAW